MADAEAPEMLEEAGLDADPPLHEDGDYVRYNSAAPPCFRYSSKFRATCEYSPCCRCFGRVGVQSCEPAPRRKLLLSVALAVNVVSLVFVVVAVCALASNYSTVRNTAWSRGTLLNVNATMVRYLTRGAVNGTSAGNVDVFIGLSGAALEVTSADSGEILYERYDSWKSSTICGGLQHTQGVTFCESCRDAALGTVVPAVMAAVTMIPTFQTDIQRMSRKHDMNCQKFLAVLFSGCVGCLTTLSSFSVFLASCRNNLPRDIAGSPASWKVGVAFLLVVLATLLKLVDAGIHLAVPTPKIMWATSAERSAMATGQKDTEPAANVG